GKKHIDISLYDDQHQERLGRHRHAIRNDDCVHSLRAVRVDAKISTASRRRSRIRPTRTSERSFLLADRGGGVCAWILLGVSPRNVNSPAQLPSALILK